ncbi:MAG: dephospho-CoA kinase [Candidatus Zixiibacteriota bacterium]
MIIGLTGQIGAGKSTAAEILKTFGAFVINADDIGRTVVEKSLPLRRNLVKAFGPSILDRKGNLNRRKLATLAFATPEATARLNALVHPPLIKLLESQIKAATKKYPVVIVDAALLLQWPLYKKLNQIVLIAAPEKNRLKRMTDRGISLTDAKARQKVQPSANAMRQAAHVVISNNGTTADLAGKLVLYWNRYVLVRLARTTKRKTR